MISLVILTHNEQEKLASHLPALLSQQGTDYEVIVVDMYSEDETADLLTSIEENCHSLRHLSLPANARDISHERLALHLGMRAAIASRVLLLDADTELPSEHWLSDIEKVWTADYDFLLVPTLRTRIKRPGSYFNARHEAWHNNLYIRQAARYGLFRAGNCIVGLKKEMFLRYNAPAGHLALKTGTMDIFLSYMANHDNTAIVSDRELFPCHDAKNGRHFWSQRRLFSVETSHHLSKRCLRSLTYVLHCLCTIHRGSIPYSLQDFYDNIRWSMTGRKTFVKKHY